jgi:hypothetical protein
MGYRVPWAVCNGYATFAAIPLQPHDAAHQCTAHLLSMPDGATPHPHVYLAITIASRAWVDVVRKLMHNPLCSSECSPSAKHRRSSVQQEAVNMTADSHQDTQKHVRIPGTGDCWAQARVQAAELNNGCRQPHNEKNGYTTHRTGRARPGGGGQDDGCE